MGSCHALTGARAERARVFLRRIADVLEHHGVPYWLDSGTLLGVVREQRFIPWDTDIDLSVRAGDVHRLLDALPQLRKLGYRIDVRRFAHDHGFCRAGDVRIVKVRSRRWRFFRGDLLLDIFVQYRHDERYFFAIKKKREAVPQFRSVPAHYFDTLDRVSFDGKTYPSPSSCDAYLTYRYGNWRTPVTQWNCFDDDLAAIEPQAADIELKENDLLVPTADH